MANDQDTLFSSNWDIDKILTSGVSQIVVPSFGSSVVVVDLTTYGLSRAPNVFVTSSVDGGLTWYLSGGGDFASTDTGYVTVTSNAIQWAGDGSLTGSTILVKYFVFNSGIVSQ